MAEAIRSYEDLEVWQAGIELSLRVYGLVECLPRSERYELSSQLRRASVSIPSNVAEGHARRTPKPYLNHVHIALGSLAELVTCLVIANRLGYVRVEEFDTAMRETRRLGQLLHGLARSLDRRIDYQRLTIALALFAGGLVGWLSALA